MPQFYRFSHPISNQYPTMIELFTRKLDAIQLPEDTVITPLPIDEDISSLSAILLDDDYYEFLKQGKVIVNGVTVLHAAYLIPFKAKAWLDLREKKDVDSSDIKKHRNDIIRIVSDMVLQKCILPDEVRKDMEKFIEQFDVTESELKNLKIRGTKPEDIKRVLQTTYLD